MNNLERYLLAVSVLGGPACYSGAEPAEVDPDAATGTSDADASATGEDDSAGGDGPSDAPIGSCDAPADAGPVSLRRLTSHFYDGAVRALLGDTSDRGRTFTSDEPVGLFISNSVAPVSELAVEQYMNAAEDIAARAVTDLAAILPCDPQAGEASACAETFVSEFGRRAFRRPLTADEVAAAMALFEAGRDDGGSFADGIELVIAGMLQSPHFLYMPEHGAADQTGDVRRLSGLEIATRLAFFLWAEPPDEALLAAAEAGELETRADVERWAREMLEDPRSSQARDLFFRQWVGLKELESVSKDPGAFPDWSPGLGRRLEGEVGDFADHVLVEDDGRLETLLTATYTVGDDRLAAFYGASAPADPDADGIGRIDLDPRQRAGLITQAGWLAATSHEDQTSPVLRGKMIREHLLCQTLPSPPDDVDDTPPAVDPEAGAQDRYGPMLEDATCAGCHRLMNPVGFMLEHYDGIGAYRDVDGNVDVDASGELFDTDVDGAVDGAISLAATLAKSGNVRACFAKQWSRFATGRIETEADACSGEFVMSTFSDSDFDVNELMVAVAASDAMRFIRVE